MNQPSKPSQLSKLSPLSKPSPPSKPLNVRITNTGVYLNGRLLLPITADDSLTAIYRHLETDYPKFHKMDELSKSAFLGVELLKAHDPLLSTYNEDKVSLLFCNCSSCDSSDLKFEQSYAVNGSASPSHFVYTLPNIMMGEVAIRNKWYGEQQFLFQPAPDFTVIAENLVLLFNNGAEACIFAWVDIREKRDVFFVLLTPQHDIPSLASALEKLYITTHD
ncbi:MAG: hypothetical protein V4616_11935 [Bacteroidota bacterium]